jgi:hypothetical protein
MLNALDRQETVARVFADFFVGWQVASSVALVFTEVVNGLDFAAAKGDVLTV